MGILFSFVGCAILANKVRPHPVPGFAHFATRLGHLLQLLAYFPTCLPACLVLGCLCQSAHPLVVVLRASIASRPLFIQTHTMHVIQSVSHLWTRGASTTFLIYSSLTLLRGGWGRGRGNGAAAVIYSCMCISWMLRIVLRELCIHGSVFGEPGISLAGILSLLFSQWMYVGWWTIYFIKLWSILIAETLIFNSIFGDGGKQDAQKFPGLQPNQQKRNSGGVGGWKFTSRTWEKKYKKMTLGSG